MPVAVEQVEVGDRVMCWYPGWDLAEPVTVSRISEGSSSCWLELPLDLSHPSNASLA